MRSITHVLFVIFHDDFSFILSPTKQIFCTLENIITEKLLLFQVVFIKDLAIILE